MSAHLLRGVLHVDGKPVGHVPPMVARPAFDWVREAGVLRGELLALEAFIAGGMSREALLGNVRRALGEQLHRLNSHFDTPAPGASREG